MGRIKEIKRASDIEVKCVQLGASWTRAGYYELSVGQHVITPGASRGVIKGFRLIDTSSTGPCSPADCTVLVEDDDGNVTVHAASDIDPLPFLEAA